MTLPTSLDMVRQQILDLEGLVRASLLNGVIATQVVMQGGDGNLGDVVVVAQGGPVPPSAPAVKLALAATLANAGRVLGVLIAPVAEGTSGLCAISGVLPPSITGLTATQGKVIVNTLTGRCERVGAFSPGDFAVGSVDSDGNLTVNAINDTGSGGGGGSGGVAGIGTPSSPGLLRLTPGSSNLFAVHVGGFWSLADSGGGSFYWDASSTDADDLGTCINPTGNVGPGRWKRIFSGHMHGDWFGLRGDASRTEGNSTGTDDTATFQSALGVAVASNYRLTLSATKAYRIAGTLSMDNMTGAVVDGGGGPMRTNTSGALLKFTGARKGNTPGVWMRSQTGCEWISVRFDTTAVPSTPATADWSTANGAARLVLAGISQSDVGKTAEDAGVDFTYATTGARPAATAMSAGDVGKTALDQDTGLYWILTVASSVRTWLAVAQRTTHFTYANAAARAAAAGAGWTSGDVGKYARDLDTGAQWLAHSVNAGAVTWTQITVLRFQYCGTDANAQGTPWLPESLSIIECGFGNKYLSTQTANGSAFNKFRRCLFKDHDHSTWRVFDRAIRMASTISSDVFECYFVNVRTGVGGSGQSFGSGFSNKNNVHTCTFVNCDDYGVVNPSENWTIQDCIFEGHSDGSADGVKFTFGGSHAVNLIGNWHGDHSNGTCLVLLGVQGIKISGCMFALGCDRAATINACFGLEASGNYVYGAWEFQGSANSSQWCAIGPNHWGGAGLEVLGTSACQDLRWQGHNAFLFGSNFQGTPGACSANFGLSNSCTGANSFAMGTLAQATGNQAACFGFNCVADGPNSMALGVCGRAHRQAQWSCGGNDAGALAVGAFSANIMPISLSSSITTGTTGTMQDAIGGTTFVLENGRTYHFLVNWVAQQNTTTPTKRFGAIQRVLATCQGGIATVDVDHTDDVSDPQTTGNTVACTASGATLSFAMTNNSGVAMLAGASLSWSEILG